MLRDGSKADVSLVLQQPEKCLTFPSLKATKRIAVILFNRCKLHDALQKNQMLQNKTGNKKMNLTVMVGKNCVCALWRINTEHLNLKCAPNYVQSNLFVFNHLLLSLS